MGNMLHNIWIFISNSWNVLQGFLSKEAIAAAIIGAMVGGIFVLYVHFSPSQKMKDQCKREARQMFNALGAEKALFDMQMIFKRNPINIFYKKIPLKNEEGIGVDVDLLKNSCAIKGGSGCGKSALIKYLFCREYKWNFLKNRKLILYFDSNKIRNVLDNPDELYNRLTNAGFKSLSLYLDGIDETVLPKEHEKLSSFLDKVSRSVNKFYIKISCRSNYSYTIDKYFRNQYQLELYEIDKWTKKQIYEYISRMIVLLVKDKRQRTRLKNFFNQDYAIDSIDYNPLLAKMLLCIKLYDGDYIPPENKYEFYYSFLRTLTEERYSVKRQVPVFIKHIDNNAQYTFCSYKNDVRNREFSRIPYFDSVIMKKSEHGTVVFRHESFYEFLVAHYVGMKLQSVSQDSIDVLSMEYPNGISDFVSDKLKLGDTNRLSIRNNLLSFYGLTISEVQQNDYNKLFKDHLNKEILQDPYADAIAKLDNNRFFTLKYEIVFRIGRLLLEDEVLNSFLRFAYYDDNVSIQPLKEPERNQWIIVLKRCCAISASFVGYEDIEIDYIKHMLIYRNEYQSLYDLINRSHTLIFYEDVKMDNNGILSFLEVMDNGKNDCTKSCMKRVTRLSKLKDYTGPVSEMNKKDRRLYYFRLFDIATIYTFIASRKSRELLPWLNKDNIAILNSFQTRFSGISKEREDLLIEIKKETNNLLRSCNII